MQLLLGFSVRRDDFLLHVWKFITLNMQSCIPWFCSPQPPHPPGAESRVVGPRFHLVGRVYFRISFESTRINFWIRLLLSFCTAANFAHMFVNCARISSLKEASFCTNDKQHSMSSLQPLDAEELDPTRQYQKWRQNTRFNWGEGPWRAVSYAGTTKNKRSKRDKNSLTCFSHQRATTAKWRIVTDMRNIF